MRQLELFNDTTQKFKNELNKAQLDHWLHHEKAQESIHDQINQWSIDLKRRLFLDNPFQEYFNTYEKFLNTEEIGLLDAIDAYSNFSKFAGVPDQSSYWKKENANPEIDHNKLRQQLFKDWKKNLDQRSADWELKKIDQLREQFLNQLLEQFKNFEYLKNLAEKLGFDTGIFLDYSKGSLTEQDIQQFKRWVEHLSNNESLSKILDVLGKIQQAHLAQEKMDISTKSSVESFVPDINSREEIIGIRLGNELEFVLPSELALLSDPETEILFDLKYIESNLMCFEMQGLQAISHEVDIVSSVDEVAKGPMILCIDTSGSMSGTPEFIAKAVALYFAQQAMKEKRACYLINFSTSIQTLELTKPDGLNTLINFLKMSFHGGTDVAPALDFALNLLKKESYQKSDILIISDFIMATSSSKQMDKIDLAKQNNNAFYSLVIGNSPINQFSRNYFDREWLFNPRNSSVSEIINLLK